MKCFRGDASEASLHNETLQKNDGISCSFRIKNASDKMLWKR